MSATYSVFGRNDNHAALTSGRKRAPSRPPCSSSAHDERRRGNQEAWPVRSAPETALAPREGQRRRRRPSGEREPREENRAK
mmetsp:Transcript_14145/g.56400  ORF Transcript_14145/g.56400 Transcript_14145/m.56400 type:complete len:82 (+) Transcript_14145:95-340(+)